MANRFLTPNIVAAEALKRLKHALVFPRVFRPAVTVADLGAAFNAKIGKSYKVKRPYYANVTKGRMMPPASDLVDREITISVGDQYNGRLDVDMEAITFELVAYSERYLKPHIEQLAYTYDRESAKAVFDAVGYSAGTPGTQFSFAAGQKVEAQAVDMAMPVDNRFMALSPYDVAALGIEMQRGRPEIGGGAGAQEYTGGFNNPGEIRDALRASFRGNIAGFMLFSSSQTPPMAVHDYGTATPLVNASGGYQGSRVPTDGWGTTPRKVLNKGQLIRFQSASVTVKHTKPRQEAETTGWPATFVVTEDVSCDATGAATVPIFPEINAGTLEENGANVGAWRTTDVPLPDNIPLLVLGTKGKTYYRGLAAVPDVGVSIPVRIEAPPAAYNEGNAFHQTDEETGLSILLTRDWKQEDLSGTDRLDALVTANPYFAETGIILLSAEKVH